MQKVVLVISIFFAAGCLALTGCAVAPATGPARASAPASATPLSTRDKAALTDLDQAAGSSADVIGHITRVDCWTPSEHLIDGAASAGTFSVICRVHYDQSNVHRYKDMTCIGDFYKTPMLTRCYRWAYYSAEPTFQDGKRLASPPPSPFPSPSVAP